MVASFLHLLEFHVPNREGGDWLRWKLSNVHSIVRSFYEILRGSSSVFSLESKMKG